MFVMKLEEGDDLWYFNSRVLIYVIGDNFNF